MTTAVACAGQRSEGDRLMEKLVKIEKQLRAASTKNAGAQAHAQPATNHLGGAIACLIGAQMHTDSAMQMLLVAVEELRERVAILERGQVPG